MHRVVAQEADQASENKETMETTVSRELIGAGAREDAAKPEHVHETSRNATGNIRNEVIPLLRGHLIDAQREVQDTSVRELPLRILPLLRGHLLDAQREVQDASVRELPLRTLRLGGGPRQWEDCMTLPRPS